MAQLPKTNHFNSKLYATRLNSSNMANLKTSLFLMAFALFYVVNAQSNTNCFDVDLGATTVEVCSNTSITNCRIVSTEHEFI